MFYKMLLSLFFVIYLHRQQQTLNDMKCILLSRVSSQQQKLNSQTDALLDAAMKEGYKRKDIIIIEDKESAIKLSEEERNGLNHMKEVIKEEPIDCVFVYELSRIARRQLVLYSIRDFLIEHNIQLVCLQPYFRMLENGKLSQTANLMFSIFASMAESEMELKKERFLRGRQHNRLTGKVAEGKPLYGYKINDDKTIEIDEEASKFVIDLFNLYSTGLHTMTTLAKELLQRYGEAGQTIYWMKGRISYILKQPKYCGDSQYPQLISRDIFDRCREIALGNATSNKYFEVCDALLKKIIYSKKSGHHMVYNAQPNKHRYMTNHETPIITIQTKHIDNDVWQLAMILHKNYVLDSEKIKKQLQEKIDVDMEKLINLQIMSKKIVEKIDKIEERVIFGKLSSEKADLMTDELNKQKKQYDNDTKKVSEELENLHQMIESKTLVELPDYTKFSQNEKIDLIRQMIKKVEIERISKSRAKAYIYTKVDSFLYTLDIDTRNNVSEMSSKMI